MPGRPTIKEEFAAMFGNTPDSSRSEQRPTSRDPATSMTAPQFQQKINEIVAASGWNIYGPPQAPSIEQPDFPNPSTIVGILERGTNHPAGQRVYGTIITDNVKDLKLVLAGGELVPLDSVKMKPPNEWVSRLALAVAQHDEAAEKWAHRQQRERLIYNAQLSLWRQTGNRSDSDPVPLTPIELAADPVRAPVKGLAFTMLILDIMQAWRDGTLTSNASEYGTLGQAVAKSPEPAEETRISLWLFVAATITIGLLLHWLRSQFSF